MIPQPGGDFPCPVARCSGLQVRCGPEYRMVWDAVSLQCGKQYLHHVKVVTDPKVDPHMDLDVRSIGAAPPAAPTSIVWG